VQINFGDIKHSGTIAICDITGRALQLTSFNLQTEVRLDVSNYSTGTYFLKIDTGDKILIRQFFLQ
jgi:hypothetical protein